MKRVAMQYSPMCAVPYVSNVDAGTVELVRSLGVEVVTSAELIQIFEARWTPDGAGIASGSRPARGQGARRGLRADPRAHAQRRAAAGSRGARTSCAKGFADAGLLTDQRPDRGLQCQRVATRTTSRAQSVTSPIKTGDWVLLDMWAKLDQPGAVYYDITWTAFCGDKPTDEMRKVFEHRDRRARCGHPARDRAPSRSGEHAARIRSGRRLPRGDRSRRGYGEYFTHRTGHSIGVKCTATAPTWTTSRPTTSGA